MPHDTHEHDHEHGHDHAHGAHHGHHPAPATFGRAFAIGIALNLFYLAVEAVVGLLIEITFIATFTQRFFSR